MKKFAMSVVVAGAMAGTALGLGTATASAAPQPAPHAQQNIHRAPVQQQIVVHRPNYGPFVYRGVRVTPHFDVKRHQWGFYSGRTWIVVVTR
ncbi:hypothetical protein SAMN05445060_1006 [Williamsia sterculiae]|uniref:Uncharacterized protein n=2 Tax=Williamsia sterculiae TaxID=1344003 RepID=A0A1N7DXV7_9NOCA|nr:hypothetical protein SAMN05445060_1006 [Williamsia sterculiae]